MSFSNQIIDEIIHNFYSGSDTQTLVLRQSEKSNFWKWFASNVRKFSVSNYPDLNFINDSNFAGGCFGNSQIIAFKSEKEYCEGFAKVKGNFIFHGFNISNNEVEDYTVLNNKEIFYDMNGDLPNIYYGIKIPKEFIEQCNKMEIEENQLNINHLIDKFFRSKYSTGAHL